MRGRPRKILTLLDKFYSIQGEAFSIGKPAFFLKFPQSLRLGKDYFFNEIIKEIKKFPTKLVIITGDEPLLYQNDIVELVKKLPKYNFEIEINGNRFPFPNLSKFKNVKFHIVFKIGLNGSVLESKYKIDKLRRFVYQDGVIFKFIIENDKDWQEMVKIINEVKISKEKVWIVPAGEKSSEIRKNLSNFFEKIKEEGYNLSPKSKLWLQ